MSATLIDFVSAAAHSIHSLRCENPRSRDSGSSNLPLAFDELPSPWTVQLVELHSLQSQLQRSRLRLLDCRLEMLWFAWRPSCCSHWHCLKFDLQSSCTDELSCSHLHRPLDLLGASSVSPPPGSSFPVLVIHRIRSCYNRNLDWVDSTFRAPPSVENHLTSRNA